MTRRTAKSRGRVRGIQLSSRVGLKTGLKNEFLRRITVTFVAVITITAILALGLLVHVTRNK